jgi:hypothetical protein
MNMSGNTMETKDELPPDQLPVPQKLTGIGNAYIQITATLEAQMWFDQGLNLIHDFWDYESGVLPLNYSRPLAEIGNDIPVSQPEFSTRSRRRQSAGTGLLHEIALQHRGITRGQSVQAQDVYFI